MKLHFDPNQAYQAEAVRAITDIFEGQPLSAGQFEFSLTGGSLLINEFGVANKLMLDESRIRKNLAVVQKRNEIDEIPDYAGMNFSVEMETGTGKTYVYLRTIYELNKLYGFKKFIIVVPSIAIREGVLKNLEITHEHFQGLYSKTPCKYFVYDSSNVSGLRSFVQNDSIQILVINIDSFAKDENVINKVNDKLTGRKPIEFIRGAHPIVIVDEPQNMETEIRKRAIANLNPLCTLRYSATHTNRYNPVYSLNPVKAYDMGLVKQIEVDSVFTQNDFNRAYVALKSVASTKTRTSAKLEIDVEGADGVRRKAVAVMIGDNLYDISNKREIYRDNFIVEKISVKNNYVRFSNGVEISKGEARGGLTDEVMKVQVKKTVEEHLEKEKKHKDRGIKVLSLFFIDRVANYRTADGQKGKIALWFEESYAELTGKPAYEGVLPYKAEQVHNGYFAQDKKGVFKDSSENRDTSNDDDAYRLIMKDKERLLDINEPLRFIFSHSALREGWDNPNVFQICTLREIATERQRRQVIGRGMRLAVDNSGIRNQERDINRLTVVASESFEEFAEGLQKEIESDCGVRFEGRIKNKRDRITVKLRKNYQLDKNFMDMWDRIRQKTTYRVEFDTEKLAQEAVKSLKSMAEIKQPVVLSRKYDLKIDKSGVASGGLLGDDLHHVDTARMDIPDIYAFIEDKTQITRNTIYRVLNESGRLEDVLKNPQLFLDLASKHIKDALNRLMIDGIKYEKIGGSEYEMRLFKDAEIESYIENLHKVRKEDKSITDYVEAMSGPERRFAEDCDSREDVEFYIKLPRWFRIETPIGPYNPDWALIMKGESKLYFVAETKSEMDPAKRRQEENDKIACGTAHFKEFEGVEYKVVRNVGELKR